MGVIAALCAWIDGLSLWQTVIPASWGELRTQLGQGMVLTLVMIAAMWGIQKIPLSGIKRLSSLSQQLLYPILKKTTFSDRVCICLSAGVGEELMFRGLLQTVIIVYWPWGTDWGLNIILGIVVSSVLFGLCHSLTKCYALLAGLIGAAFGFVYLATGSLLVPMIAHALYDLWAMDYMLWSVRREAE